MFEDQARRGRQARNFAKNVQKILDLKLSSGTDIFRKFRWVPLLKPILAPSQIFCEAFFIIWGSLLSASFIYSGLKLIHRDGNVQRQLEDIEIGQSTSRTDGQRGEKEPRKLQKFRLQQVFWVFVAVDSSFHVRRLQFL